MIFLYLTKFYHYVTHFFSPPSCLYCHASLFKRQALCSSCTATILPIVPFDFYIGTGRMVKIFAISAYKDPLRTLIVAKHYGKEAEIHLLADFLSNQPLINFLEYDIITYIPLHWTRYAVRGFNQAEIIAQALGKKMNTVVLPLLKRSKKTQYQARLSVKQREQNVRNVFYCDQRYQQHIAGKKILIIDDLFTTGATIKAAADILFVYKPLQIDSFVACRVISQ